MKWKTAKKFTHDGQSYEVRVGFDGKSLTVRAFKGSDHANGISYVSEVADVKKTQYLTGTDVVKDFVRHAKNDILDGRWESYLEACKKVKEEEERKKEEEERKKKEEERKKKEEEKKKEKKKK